MTDETTRTDQSHRLGARERVERVNARTGRDLPAAIGVAVVLVGYLIATLVFWKPGFLILLAAGMAMASIELHNALLRDAKIRTAVAPIAVGAVAMIVGAYLAQERDANFTPTTVLLVALAATVLAAFVWRLPGGQEGFVRDTSASMLTIAYIPLLGSFLALMIGAPDGPARVATFVLSVAASDVGGLAGGVLFGKHPMAPRISPKKTWEGLGGSLVLATAVAVPMTMYVLHAPAWVGALFAVLIVPVATCGDLIESMIKRDLGIKDMSHFLPGHGGILDRIDSILFAAPLGWFLLHALVPHA